MIDHLIKLPTPEDIQKERDWILNECAAIGLPLLKELAKRASDNREKSYSPYSHYAVGVALLGMSGEIYDGANVERVSYSETDHAEESAITRAVIDGEQAKVGRKFVRAVAVSHPGESAPCGRCRQIIIEHCDNALILMVTTDGEIQGITSMKVLLPYAFTPSDLGI